MNRVDKSSFAKKGERIINVLARKIYWENAPVVNTSKIP
jgi:hypothetical protein